MANIEGAAHAPTISTLGALDQELNVPEMLMAIQVERSQVLDSQIKIQLGDMKDRNNWLKDSNAALGALRTAKPKTDGGTVDTASLTFTDHTGKSQLVSEWATANGIGAALSATPEQNAKLADAKAAQASMQGAAQNWKHGPYSISDVKYTKTDGTTESTFAWAKDNEVKTMPLAWGTAGYMPPDDKGNYVMTKGQLQQSANDAAAVVAKDQAEVDAANHPNGTQIEAAIANLKSTIDTVNAQSQMDMVRLQGLMDKRNQAFEMMTNTLAKSGKSLDDIQGNMR